jgi:hypothetical protein
MIEAGGILFPTEELSSLYGMSVANGPSLNQSRRWITHNYNLNPASLPSRVLFPRTRQTQHWWLRLRVLHFIQPFISTTCTTTT